MSRYSPYVAIIDKNLKIKKNSFLINNAKKNKTFLFYNVINNNKIKYLQSKKIKLIYTPLFNHKLDFNFILRKLYMNEVSSLLIEGGKTLVSSLLKDNYFNEFYLFVSPQRLKNRGILKMKYIKQSLSSKFKKNKVNETFLYKDNLIHYY